jgi:type I restriction enzyme S subunit
MIIERASGTTFKEVSLKTISSFEIIIPPIKQQKIIVAEIEHRFSFCDKMEETISDIIQRSETLKQSIFKQAFEGKLVKTQTN